MDMWERLICSVIDQAMGRYNVTFQAERRVREYVDQYNGQWLDYFREQRRTRRQVAQIVARAMDQPVSLPAIRSVRNITPEAVLRDLLQPISRPEIPLTPEALEAEVQRLYKKRRNQ